MYLAQLSLNVEAGTPHVTQYAIVTVEGDAYLHATVFPATSSELIAGAPIAWGFEGQVWWELQSQKYQTRVYRIFPGAGGQTLLPAGQYNARLHSLGTVNQGRVTSNLFSSTLPWTEPLDLVPEEIPANRWLARQHYWCFPFAGMSGGPMIQTLIQFTRFDQVLTEGRWPFTFFDADFDPAIPRRIPRGVTSVLVWLGSGIEPADAPAFFW